jgi:hypothetical protein
MSSDATSPGHKLGQMIGNFIQDTFGDVFTKFAKRRKIYCDKQGPRPAIRGAKKRVTWIDDDGNAHDLDFVLEVGGSDAKKGDPIAFMELAWRRYTKHSRNKSGEIEGSLLHLRSTYQSCRFVGAIIAGEYSQGGLQQLQSHGIRILYIPFQKIVNAFRGKGINLEYAEDASEKVKRRIITAWQSLDTQDLNAVRAKLLRSIKKDLNAFMKSLESAISYEVESIRIVSLYGEETTCHSIQEVSNSLMTMTFRQVTSSTINSKYTCDSRAVIRLRARFKPKRKPLSFSRSSRRGSSELRCSFLMLHARVGFTSSSDPRKFNRYLC